MLALACGSTAALGREEASAAAVGDAAALSRGFHFADFTAFYYDRTDLGSFVVSRPYTTSIDFLKACWGESFPFTGCKLIDELADGQDFSVRWRTRLLVPATGSYTFSLVDVDDGARFFVDGVEIMDQGWNWPSPDRRPSPQTVQLTAGWHDVTIDYEQRIFYVASLKVKWRGPGFSDEVIPIAQPPRPHPVSPIDWTMMQSLRPTFRWLEVPEATAYVLRIYRARGTLEDPIRGENVQSVPFVGDPALCSSGLCSFKPGFPDPAAPSSRSFELTSHLSQLDPGFDPMRDDPDDTLEGYLWEVEAVVSGARVLGDTGRFQIRPLGLWEVVSNTPTNVTNPCLVHAYCREGYRGGYWNLFDDSFYRWGEIFDVPPAVLKAIAYGETLTGIGPREISKGNSFSPARAYLYEAGKDFSSAWECKEDCTSFKVSGYTPAIKPYDTKVSLNGISISRFVSEVGFSHGFDEIPGCGPEDRNAGECADATRRPAEYPTMSSYGLGQVLFYSAWPTLKNVALGVLPPPESLYEPDLAIRAMASVLGIDKRCRSLNRPSAPAYPGIDGSGDAWEDSISRFNGLSGKSTYSDRVKARLVHIDPAATREEPFDVGFELGHRASVESLVRQLIEAGTQGCETNDSDFRRAVIRYLSDLGVPVPQNLTASEFSASPEGAQASVSLASSPGGGREVSQVEVDLRGDGLPVLVTLSLEVFPETGKAGVIRVYADASRNELLFESDPVADNVLDSAFAIPVDNPATGRPVVLTEWFEGFHSSRVYPLVFDGDRVRLIPILDDRGGELNGVFSDGGGVSLFDDGSLFATRLDYLSHRHRIVDVYEVDPEDFEYRFLRSVFIDEGVLDTEPPRTSSTLDPAPGDSGWNQQATFLVLSATDDHGVRSISHTRANHARSISESSPFEVAHVLLTEGRWLVSYFATDVHHNRGAEQDVEVRVDRTPPRTEISLRGEAGEGGSFLSPVEVHLSAADRSLEDTSPGSGVARTEYDLGDGHGWRRYGGPFVITTPGATLVQYRSTDVAGNVEPAGAVTVVIIINAPPAAEDDVYRIGRDGRLAVAAPGLLENDRDPNGDPLTAVLDGGPVGGRLSLNPDGSFEYVRNPDFLTVDRFTYRASDGSLESLAAVVTLLPPLDCEELYGVDTREDALVSIDPATGAGTLVGPLGIRVETAGLGFDAKGNLWGFSQMEDDPGQGILYTVDLASGAAREVRRFDVSAFPGGAGIEFGPDGKTLFWQSGASLSILDVARGEVLPFAELPFSGAGLTLPGRCRDFLSFDSSGDRLMRVSSFDGVVEEVGFAGLGHGIDALAVAPDGTVYGHGGEKLYTFDPNDGKATLVGDIGFATLGLAFRPPYSRSFCLDARFDRKTGLSAYVVEIDEGVRHKTCPPRSRCLLHGRRDCKVCHPVQDSCGRCGSPGFYRLRKDAHMVARTPDLPVSGTYRVQFQIRAPGGGEARLRVVIGGERFVLPLSGSSWRWTEPILVDLPEGTSRIQLSSLERKPLDVDGVRVERHCRGLCEAEKSNACLDQRFDPSTGLSRYVTSLEGQSGHSPHDGCCGTRGSYFLSAPGDRIIAQLEVPDAGRYVFSFRYRTTGDRRAGAGVQAKVGTRELGFPHLGSAGVWEWSPKAEVFLQSGLQTIELVSTGSAKLQLENVRLERFCECNGRRQGPEP